MHPTSFALRRALVAAPSPSGYEQSASRVCRDYLTPIADDVTTVVIDSGHALLKGIGNSPSVMLAGHIDEIGFRG